MSAFDPLQTLACARVQLTHSPPLVSLCPSSSSSSPGCQRVRRLTLIGSLRRELVDQSEIYLRPLPCDHPQDLVAQLFELGIALQTSKGRIGVQVDREAAPSSSLHAPCCSVDATSFVRCCRDTPLRQRKRGLRWKVAALFLTHCLAGGRGRHVCIRQEECRCSPHD